MRTQHAQSGERKVRCASQSDVEAADDEIRRADRAAERLRLLAENPTQCDRTEAGTDAARPVQNADAARAGRADRENALAEDRQQQEHASGQAPAGFDKHQRGHVRLRADVPESFEQIAHSGQRREPGRPVHGWRRRVEARPADEERRCKERERRSR